MDKELRKRSREALKQGDLGEQVDDGLFIKDLGSVTRAPRRDKGEVAEAEPIPLWQRKTLTERERLVGELSARLMDYYIENLNNDFTLNPIRDGIPVCIQHQWPPGCVHGCKEGVLERKRDHTLGDVFTWVKTLLAHHYKELLIRRPELKGYMSRGTIG